jgi:hypothetical protein
MKPKLSDQSILPPSSPLGRTTRARSIAIQDAQRPNTRSHPKANNDPLQSPTKTPAKNYDMITKVGPPRGQKKNQQRSKSTAARKKDDMDTSAKPPLTGGSISDDNGWVLFPFVIIFFWDSTTRRPCHPS